MAGKRKPVEFEVNERGCHICTSHAPGTHGYPCVHKDGRNQNLHRVLYEEAHGPLGELVARHTCDDTMCINLAHVEPGTPAENTADITKRGRHNPPIGERSGTCKLSKEQVEALRLVREPQATTAARLGIAQSTVSRIKSRQRRREA